MKKPNQLLYHTLSAILLYGTMLATPVVNMMPTTSGKDLNGKPWAVPNGLPGKSTLVIIGFDESQQVAIDTWTQGLGLNHPANKIPWIEMPLIGNPGMFMRWFIDTGMRGGIKDKALRSHVWTAYTDKEAFMQSCGIATDKEICVLVVDRNGRILESESGAYSKEGGIRLLRALRGPRA